MCAQNISPPDRDAEQTARCATALRHHPKAARHAAIPPPHPMLPGLPTACPLSSSKPGLVLQQTSHLDPLLPSYHGGGRQLITSSLFTIPCLNIFQGCIALPMPSAALGEGRLHREDQRGGSHERLEVLASKKTSQSNDCTSIKAYSALHADGH